MSYEQIECGRSSIRMPVFVEGPRIGGGDYEAYISRLHGLHAQVRRDPFLRRLSFDQFSCLMQEVSVAGRQKGLRQTLDRAAILRRVHADDQFPGFPEEVIVGLVQALSPLLDHGGPGDGWVRDYLMADRACRALATMYRRLHDRAVDADGGWTEREALCHWADICGAIRPGPAFDLAFGTCMRQRGAGCMDRWQQMLRSLVKHQVGDGARRYKRSKCPTAQR